MRIYVLSDLHAERSTFTPDPSALQAADVVVLAGELPSHSSGHFVTRAFMFRGMNPAESRASRPR